MASQDDLLNQAAEHAELMRKADKKSDEHFQEMKRLMEEAKKEGEKEKGGKK